MTVASPADLAVIVALVLSVELDDTVTMFVFEDSHLRFLYMLASSASIYASSDVTLLYASAPSTSSALSILRVNPFTGGCTVT